MLLTQNNSITCANCGAIYSMQEGVKYSNKTGEARIVWKKIKLGGKVHKVSYMTTVALVCEKCQTPLPM